MEVYLGFMVLEGILAVAVVGTNLLVCITIYLHKELRSVTNYLIACLAAADLCVGALAIPFSMVLSMDYILCFYTCLFLTCFPLVTTQFSILLLLVIAINAHLKIKLPNSYAIYVKKGWMVVTVVICWLLSLLIGLSPMMGWNRLRQFVNTDNQTAPASFPSARSAFVLLPQEEPFGGFLAKVYLGRQNLNYSEIHKGHIGLCTFTSVCSPEYLVYFLFFICTLLPLIAMLAIYADLFRIVRDHFQSQALWPTKKKEMHLARTLVLLVGVFCVCWMPLQAIYLVQLLCPSCERYQSLDRLAVLLSHLNSLANPLVYALRKKDFGLALQAVLLDRVLHWPWLKTRLRRSAKVSPQA